MTPSVALVLALASVAMGAPAPAPAPPAVPPINQEEVAASVQKFSEMYRLATQLMNIGGNFLNNAQGGPPSSSAVRSNYGDGGGGNGILGDIVRPQLRGVPNYDSSYSGFSGGSAGGSASGNIFERATRMFGNLARGRDSPPPAPLSEYGGGPLGSRSGAPVQSARTTALDSILNTFLGSSFGGSGSPSSGSMTDFFSPSYEEYGNRNSRYGNNGQGSNIDAIVEALGRAGAKPARPEPESRSLLGQFFG